MNRQSLILLFTLLLTTIGASAQNVPAGEKQGTTYTLTIHMTGFRNGKGLAGVLVFCSPRGWPETNDDACRHGSVPIHNGDATIQFEGLKAGTYAAVALHDENKNKKLDRNFLGVPKEGFGFPNNIKVGLKTPSYEAASFQMNGDTKLEIKMQYK